MTLKSTTSTLNNNSNTVITKGTCNLSSVPPEGSYKLSIVRQHSLEVDTFVENGQQKSVHYVIKSSAFVLEVALKKDGVALGGNSNLGGNMLPGDGNTLDFHKITLEAELLYDCEGDKPVFKVRSRPLTTRGIVNPSSPCACKLETVVEVLSSQHEDMNFKIKLTAVDVATNEPLTFIPPVYSAPFQVISKPDVLLKKKQKRTKKGPRNKTKQDQVLEALARIESRQTSQQNQIDFILSMQPSNGGYTNSTPGQVGKISVQPSTLCGNKRPLSEISTPQVPSLETAYFQFLAAYDSVKRSERPAKLRKLFSNSSVTDLANFTEAAQSLQHQQYQPQQVQNVTQEPQPVLFCDDISLGPSLEQLLADLS